MLHRKCKCSRVTEEGIRSEFQREFNFFWNLSPFLPTSHYPQTVGKLEPKQTNEEKERKIPIEALKRYIQDAASIAPEASSPIDFRNFNNAHFRSDSPFSFCPLLAHLQRGTSRFSNAWKEHTHRGELSLPRARTQAAISRHCSQYAGEAGDLKGGDLKRENSQLFSLHTRENLCFVSGCKLVTLIPFLSTCNFVIIELRYILYIFQEENSFPSSIHFNMVRSLILIFTSLLINRLFKNPSPTPIPFPHRQREILPVRGAGSCR